MLYALIDYWNYSRRQGRYSASSMAKQGFSLALEKNFQDYRSIPLGHIVFVSTSDSITSWVVMYVGDGAISHVTMFYGDGVLHDTITSGVQRRDFSEYFDGRSYIAIQAPPPGTDLAYSKKFMDETVGASYNWLGIARLGFATLIGKSPGSPWYLCADVWLTTAMVSGLNWFVTDDLSTTFIAILVAYPALFAFNKFRNRNWLKKVIEQKKSISD